MELTHERVEVEGGRQEVIRRYILLRGDLDEAQRERLLYIAGRCPVSRTLTGDLRIEDRLGRPA